MKLNDILDNTYNFVESRKDKVFETVAFILYFAGIVCMAYFHEPWFDEFQALQISKASVRDILFVIPHMEGHPPLWHLILKFTSIFTNNPELCIKIPNVIFATLAAGLLIFKSPFCRIVRITLPFTYFIFYQYGVINRPYSIMMFALFLIAYLYQKKNEKPFLYGLSLGLLCLSSCYGIILAFAITLVWLIEIWNKQKLGTFIKSFIVDKRFYSMLFLFLLCLFIFFEIYPVTNDVARPQFYYCPTWQRILYALFGMIADATFSNIANISNIGGVSFIDVTSVIAMCIGAYITYLLFKHFLQNNFLLFLLTYSLFIIFIYFGYFYQHHIGILTLIFIFNFWCLYNKNNQSQKICLDKYLKVMICIILVVQIYWGISACYNDIKWDYSYGRQISIYLKNNNIVHNYKIFCPWWSEKNYFDTSGKKIKTMKEITQEGKTIAQITIQDIFRHQPFAVGINVYFNKNIFYNFNVLNSDCSYTLHYDTEDIAIDKVFAKWKSLGEPDIIFTSSGVNNWCVMKDIHPELKKIKFPWERVYGNSFDIRKQYIIMKTFPLGSIWKSELCSGDMVMYVKKSLFDTAKNWK